MHFDPNHIAFSTTSTNNLTTPDPYPAEIRDARQAVLNALGQGDLEAFTLSSTCLAHDMMALRFERGQNCLHQAIKSGQHSIALYLAQCSEPWMPALIDEPDDLGHTPLNIAIDAAQDLADLVDALLTAGARDNPSEALAHAACNGHTETNTRLIAAGANPSIALALAVHQPKSVDHHAQAVRLLRALGADVDAALEVAVARGWPHAIRTLAWLGAHSTDALVVAARNHDRAALENLIMGGADVTSALMRLARDAMGTAAEFLMAEQGRLCRAFGYDRHAVLRLANSGDIAAMRILTPHLSGGAFYCRGLAESGNVDAIRVLSEAGLLSPADLVSTVREGDLKAARTLIQAGVSTAEILRELRHASAGRELTSDTYKKIRLLHAAGADTSTLPIRRTATVSDDLNNRRAAFASLSADDKNLQLLWAAINGNVPDVALLLELGANPAVALKELNADWDVGTRYTLIKAGMDGPRVLLDLVRAGDMETARALVLTHGVSTEAILQLIRNGERETARAFIPDLTDGSDELIDAALSDDRTLALELVALGANGPMALLRSLAAQRNEAAGRLIEWDIDLDVTLMLAFRHREEIFGSFDPTIPITLRLLGAQLDNALRHAQARGEAEAARRLITDHPHVGRDALLRLSEGAPDAVKRATLQFLLAAGVNAHDVITSLAHDQQHLGNLARLRALVSLGLPTAGSLMELGGMHHRNTAANVINAGGDIASALNQLVQKAANFTRNGDTGAARVAQDAANDLAVALAGLAPAWATEFNPMPAGGQVVILP
jgi:ankyrin repeat protein